MNLKLLRCKSKILLATLSFSAYSLTELEIGGFVDAQYSWAKTQAAATLSTFTVPDGALYLSAHPEHYELFVDMPFAAGPSSGDFLRFHDKGQAWFGGVLLGGKFHWRLGQFDSLLGFEGGDGVDLTFAKGGIISSTVFSVHRGMNVGFTPAEGWDFDFVISNPYSEVQGNMRAGNPALGLSVNFVHEELFANLGSVFERNAIFDKQTYFIDFFMGIKLEAWEIALELATQKNSADELSIDKASYMAGAHLKHSLSDLWQLATSLEFIGLDGQKSAEWRVGPQIRLSDAQTAKLDYTLLYRSADDAHAHAVNLALVQSF